MNKAKEIASFLLFLRDHDPRRLEMNNSKLNVLLYLLQGYHLGLYGKPFFEEDIHIYKEIVIVPHIFQPYRLYGDLNIPEKGIEPTSLTEKEIGLVAFIWKKYGEYGHNSLTDIIHVHSPRLNTWVEKKTIIDKQPIQDFFQKENFIIAQKLRL